MITQEDTIFCAGLPPSADSRQIEEFFGLLEPSSLTNRLERSVSGSTNTRTVTQRVRQPSHTKTLNLQLPLLIGSMGNYLRRTQSKFQSHKGRLQLVDLVGEEDVVEVEVEAETEVAEATGEVEEVVVVEAVAVVAQVVTTGYAVTARILTLPAERNVIAAKHPSQVVEAVVVVGEEEAMEADVEVIVEVVVTDTNVPIIGYRFPMIIGGQRTRGTMDLGDNGLGDNGLGTMDIGGNSFHDWKYLN